MDLLILVANSHGQITRQSHNISQIQQKRNYFLSSCVKRWSKLPYVVCDSTSLIIMKGHIN